MKLCKLKYIPKRSFKQTEKFIRDLILHGDHSLSDDFRCMNSNQIKEFFTINGYPYRKVIEEYRDISVPSVPLIENIINDICHQIVEFKNGKSIAGLNIRSDYKEKTRSAIKTKDRTLELFEIEEYYSALSKMVSAIESFFSQKAIEYNEKNGREILIDTKSNPVALVDKFTRWVPVMTGKSYDKNSKAWNIFKKQLTLRHDFAIHPKFSTQSISYEDLANHLNDFRDGISTVFYQLQVNYFNEHVRAPLIREIHKTNVIVTYDEQSIPVIKIGYA
ncbi:hypothetical protein ACYVOR_003499 [Vibrio cholerae]|uniref:hypothetical protein n=1 Tax=Vibrio cholerae TaxID=666 RepID=UPI00053C2948|nr:hypothetical protein [Vibrio cholerae]